MFWKINFTLNYEYVENDHILRECIIVANDKTEALINFRKWMESSHKKVKPIIKEIAEIKCNDFGIIFQNAFSFD